MSGKQEVLQVYAGWRHALRNLKLPEKGFFFYFWRLARFPSAGLTPATLSAQTDICEHLGRRGDFFLLLFLPLRWNLLLGIFISSQVEFETQECVCVLCVWGLQVHLDTHPVRSSRNHIIQQRRRSAGFRVVLVVIWAVWSRMDYMDSGLRYTPKTSVSNLLLCRSGGGSCWLKVVTPCLCFYLLPEWFCSLACLWDIWETVIGQEVEQNLKL